jgi:hypothetical protein
LNCDNSTTVTTEIALTDAEVAALEADAAAHDVKVGEAIKRRVLGLEKSGVIRCEYSLFA